MLKYIVCTSWKATFYITALDVGCINKSALVIGRVSCKLRRARCYYLNIIIKSPFFFILAVLFTEGELRKN